MPTTQSTAPLHTGALITPVRRRDVRAFYRTFAERHPEVRGRLGPAQRVAAAIGVGVLPIFLLAMVVGISEEVEDDGADMAGQLVGMGAVIVLMLVGSGFLAHFYVRSRRRRGTPTRHFRLAHFATDNAMGYEPGPYNGDHIVPWRDRGRIAVSRVIRPRIQRPVEFANFELTYGSSSSRHRQFGGYCSIRLSTRLPNIVLKSTTGGISQLTLQAVPVGAQRLSLEGDFDSHFTLYCPEGYERDALYLFTPDVMARLIDSVHGFDVEIIDDWLFLVRTSDVVTLRPDTWTGLVDATNALLEKIGRWERWREDREPDAPDSHPLLVTGVPSSEQVAAPGRRLRMTSGRGALLWSAFFLAFVVATVFAVVLR